MINKKMRTSYIRAEEFKDFCKNQETLINILNHRMTTLDTSVAKIGTDVGWLKRSLWAIVSVLVAIFLTMITKYTMGA